MNIVDLLKVQQTTRCKTWNGAVFFLFFYYNRIKKKRTSWQKIQTKNKAVRIKTSWSLWIMCIYSSEHDGRMWRSEFKKNCDRYNESRNATKTRSWQRRGKTSLMVKRQTEWKRQYLPERRGPLSQWKWRTHCDSGPWDWLLLSGSTARVRSLAYGPSLFRVQGEEGGGKGWQCRGVTEELKAGAQGRLEKGLRKRWIEKKSMDTHREDTVQLNETERQQRRAARSRPTPKNWNVEEVWSKRNDWNRCATVTCLKGPNSQLYFTVVNSCTFFCS